MTKKNSTKKTSPLTKSKPTDSKPSRRTKPVARKTPDAVAEDGVVAEKDGSLVVDLDKICSKETIAKLYVLCERRGLTFPDAVSLLLDEVREPSESSTKPVKAKCSAKPLAKSPVAKKSAIAKRPTKSSSRRTTRKR